MTVPPVRVVVDLSAVRDNVAALVRHADGAAVLAVVKADGYGHGLVPVARAALAGGATWLGVAQLAEALTLRAALAGGGPGPRILTWLYTPGADLDAALDADLDLAVSAPWALAEVVAAARRTGRAARVHLKVDTGMGRGGARPEQWPDLVAAALAAEADGALAVVGVFSHLACADDPASPVTAEQTAAFRAAVAVAEDAGARLEVRHLAASAGLLLHPETRFDLVRPGIAVYGLSPAPDVLSAADAGLRPAMRLEADLTLVKPVPAGTPVSYGHTATTPAPTVLGVVPVGYADGVPRHASDRGPVQVGGRRAAVVGRVCMDQIVVDLGPAGARPGDTVVLFGDGRDGGPTADDWAEAAGTISYEIVTRFGARLPRVYVGEEDA